MIEISKGAYLFRGALSLEQQQRLVSWYKDSIDDFYRPRLKSGSYMNLRMNCLGHHWSAVDYEYHDVRIDADEKPTQPMPEYLQEWATPFSTACFKEYYPEWDICIANYYRPGGSLGMHSDNSETPPSLAGKPVVSFSVGADCIFQFGGCRRRDPHQDVRLSSGDVFVFGGVARTNYHGVSKVILTENAFNKELENGRLNITLREL